MWPSLAQSICTLHSPLRQHLTRVAQSADVGEVVSGSTHCRCPGEKWEVGPPIAKTSGADTWERRRKTKLYDSSLTNDWWAHTHRTTCVCVCVISCVCRMNKVLAESFQSLLNKTKWQNIRRWSVRKLPSLSPLLLLPSCGCLCPVYVFLHSLLLVQSHDVKLELFASTCSLAVRTRTDTHTHTALLLVRYLTFWILFHLFYS